MNDEGPGGGGWRRVFGQRWRAGEQGRVETEKKKKKKKKKRLDWVGAKWPAMLKKSLLFFFPFFLSLTSFCLGERTGEERGEREGVSSCSFIPSSSPADKVSASQACATKNQGWSRSRAAMSFPSSPGNDGGALHIAEALSSSTCDRRTFIARNIRHAGPRRWGDESSKTFGMEHLRASLSPPPPPSPRGLESKCSRPFAEYVFFWF